MRTAATTAILDKLATAYGLTGYRLLAAQKGYRNASHPIRLPTGQVLNLIIYKAEPGMLARIRRADNLSQYLAEQGFPARQRQAAIAKLTSAQQAGPRYAGLYNYLPGATIPWEAYTKDHIKLLGKAQSAMHHLLGNNLLRNAVRLPDIIDECRRLADAMAGYFALEGVQSALHSKLGLAYAPASNNSTWQGLLAACRQLPQNQPLHMDFVRGNILFSDSKPHTEPYLWLDNKLRPPYLTGVVDFEKVASGPPVFDVARTLAFLLVDCKYKQPHKIIKYFIDSGYQKRGANTLDNGQLTVLPELTRFYMLHDFYKFLRHNQYEYLLQNQHFVRTRDFLLKDGIIDSTS